MKPLSILTLAAALALQATASAANCLNGEGPLMPGQIYCKDDPEYKRLLAEEQGKLRIPYTKEYSDKLAEQDAMKRFLAGEKASPFVLDLGTPFTPTEQQKGDFAKGDLVKPDGPEAGQQALDTLAKDAIEKGGVLSTYQGPMPDGSNLGDKGVEMVKDGQETLDTFDKLQAELEDYDKVLEEAKKEGLNVGKGFTIVTYTGEDGKLMQRIDTPNSCGIPFPAGNPPISLREAMKEMMKSVAEQKTKLAAERDKLVEDKKALLTANKNAFNTQSCLNCRETPPAPGEEDSENPAGPETADTEPTEESGRSETAGAMGATGAKGGDTETADHQAAMIASAITQARGQVAGIDAHQALTANAKLTFEKAKESETLLFVREKAQPMRNMGGSISLKGDLLDDIGNIFLNMMFEHNTAPPIKVEAAPDTIMKPAAPSKPAQNPGDDKGA